MKKKTDNISIEGARIAFKNFSGEPGKYNPAGSRNFCLMLDADLAAVLRDDGWNVKQLHPREEGDEPQDYVQVAVSYDNVPPTVIMITSGGKSRLDEMSINTLDWAEIAHIDVIVSPYHWDVNGKQGIKAYLRTMYVTIREDEFASKYIDVPDSAATSTRQEPLGYEY